VKAIDLKMWRDLWQMKSQMAAIALVLTCGIATFIMFLSTLDALRATQDSYYRAYHFAELFASLKRAPESLRQRIAEVDGVAQVETRVVSQVRLEMPGFGEPVMGLMVSIPASGAGGLNALYLRSGRLPVEDSPGEVVVSTPFAQAHGLQPGDRFGALLNGRRQQMTVVGTALSPEFVQQMRPGSAFPDYKRYGVLWMGRRALGQAYDMHGAFNDLAASLRPGADLRYVIDRVDELLAPYGGQGAYARKDQRSHRFLTQELAQLGILASLFPAIFLGISAFLLNVAVSRLVALQRGQVATLKAFGYSNAAVLWHYLKLVAVVAGAGIIGGIVLGTWLGKALSDLYTQFYHFPYLKFGLQPGMLLGGVLVSLASAAAGTAFAIWRAARLKPAQAMRPPSPDTYRQSWIERLGLKRILSQPSRMILRNILRHRVKSTLTVLGIALACGIIPTGLFQRDTVSYMVNLQFALVQREDLSVTFTEPTGWRARSELLALPGVIHAEPFRNVPVRLRNGPRSYTSAIRGLQPGGDLVRVLDADLRPVALPEDGIVLTDFLATMLGLRIGDRLVVEVLEGSRPLRAVTVAGLVHEYIGVSAYMQLEALNRLMREGRTLSGAYLAVDSARLATLFARLDGLPRVAGVAERAQEIRNFNRVMRETMLFFTYVATAFAVVIAFGVIYNSARIALTERGRELASLRVLGFTRGEIAYVLLGELAVLTVLAIPIGLVLGRSMCYYIAREMQNDLFRVPVVLMPQTYAISAVVVLASAALSGVAVRARLDKLDLIAVLKAAE
jgi:putative ABC transport system permease protein